MSRHRTLVSGGGCARKTISLSADTVKRVGDYLASPAGAGLTFSAFVADSLEVTLGRIDQLNSKKKDR